MSASIPTSLTARLTAVDLLLTGRSPAASPVLGVVSPRLVIGGFRIRAIRAFRCRIERSDGGGMEATKDHTRPNRDAMSCLVEVVAGPDCRRPVVIGVGRFVVGRDRACDIRIDDETIAPFHVVVDLRRAAVDAATEDCWSIEIVPLVGTRPTQLDGDPLAAAPGGRLRRPLGHGVHLDVGASVVRIAPSQTGVDAGAHADDAGRSRLVPDDAGRFVVHRRFSVGCSPRPVVVRVPDGPTGVPGPPATGLIGAFVGVVGALVVSTVVGSAVMALFASVTAAASLSMWSGSWLRVLRERRRQRLDRSAELDRFERDLRRAAAEYTCDEYQKTPGIGPVLRAGLGPPTPLVPGVWVQRTAPPRDSAALPAVRATVGSGRRRWSAALGSPDDNDVGAAGAADVLERLALVAEVSDAPIVIELSAGRSIAVTGGWRRAVARSIVAQLAWSSGPSDWRLVVVTDEPARWDWVAELPHLLDDTSIVDVRSPSAAGASDRLADAMSSCAVPLHVVVVDLLSERAGVDVVVRAALDRTEVTALVLVDEPPSWVDEVVHVGQSGALDHRRPGGSDLIAGVGVGISHRTAASVAAVVGRLVDPEVFEGGSIPERCGFIDTQFAVAGASDRCLDDAITRWWNRAGVDPPPISWLGLDRAGPTAVDLLADGPHVLLAGTTGSGKSEFLRTLVLGLAVRTSPAHLGFVLVDYKGGAAFDACAELPHVLGQVTDLDGGLAARALAGLDAELRRRSERFRALGVSDLREYRARDPSSVEPMPRLVVVVDEFATLAKELPEFLASLVDVAQRGRSLGLHLILATQRPAGVVSDDIRANTALRIALRTEDEGDSRDVIGVGAAAQLPRRLPGRALRRREDGGVAEFQVASTAGPAPEDDESTELEQVVAAIREAHRRESSGCARALWLPPLPNAIAPDRLSAELEAGSTVEGAVEVRERSAPTIGVIDDPAHQCRRPLRWVLGDGSLLLVGSAGSGGTSTLIALGAAALADVDPDAVHLAVIDVHGDRRLEVFESLAHSLGSVRATDEERLRRLLDRLVDPEGGCGDRRRPDRTVVLIDGLDALWQQLIVPEPGTDAGLAVSLRQLVLRADDLDVDLIATTRGGSLPTGFTARETWVGSLDDPTGARAAGWSGESVGRAHPGRFGVVSTGLVAQVALGAPGLAELPLRSATSSGPRTIARLPLRVVMGELEAAAATEPVIDIGGRPARGDVEDVVPIGLDAEWLVPIGPRLAAGRHLLVVGRPGSGITTTLRSIRSAWLARRPHGVVFEVEDDASMEEVVDDGVRTSSSGDVLVLVDDAHRVADVDARLSALLDGVGRAQWRGSPPASVSGVSVVAGIRIEAFRSAYGHWTRSLAAGEHGIALTTSGEPPTEVFGVAAPRRPVVAARPGLGWLVDGGRCRSMQIATVDDLDAAASGPT